jgi:nucleotide-binding universal stress UspA family protein
MPTPRTILVPVDFSSHSDRALEYAVDLARALGARVHVLHVYHVPIYGGVGDFASAQLALMEIVREGAQKGMDDTVEKVRASGVAVEGHLAEGFPAGQIVETAGRVGADLIVMGTQGRTGLEHFMLGSVAERTLRTAPCPVLTVKAK